MERSWREGVDRLFKTLNIDEFIIYLPRVLCHIPVVLSVILSSCHPVCRSCGTLSYSLCFSNQIDQGDETEGLEREGLEILR